MLSVILTFGMHLACGLAYFAPLTWPLLALAIGSYLLRMWSITAGYHRYFAHRSYQTSRWFRFVLAVLGTSAMQNGPLWWASWHRRHHKHSDTAADPHSPKMTGFWRAHWGWFLDGSHDEPDLSNVSDLERVPELRWLDKHKWIPIVGYAVVCFAIMGLPGVVWGFVIPTILSLHATALINSLAHVWGTRPYPTRDDSRNNALLALLTLGEGWHNNHHHAMSATSQGHRWWQIDPTYWSLWILARLGIVWGLRPVPQSVRATRRPLVRLPVPRARVSVPS